MKGGRKDFANRLRSIDWNPFHPKYHFAIAVLEDRFIDAVALMKNAAVQQEVTEKHLREWPLLRDEFQDAFREIYGKNFADQLLQETEDKIEAEQSAPANPNSTGDSSSSAAE